MILHKHKIKDTIVCKKESLDLKPVIFIIRHHSTLQRSNQERIIAFSFLKTNITFHTGILLAKNSFVLTDYLIGF